MRIAERLFNLLIVFLLLSATAALTGQFWGHSPQNKDENRAEVKSTAAPTAKDLQALGIMQEVELKQRTDAVWQVNAVEGKDLGTILYSGQWANDVKGFAGPTPVWIWVSRQQTIESVLPLPNEETPGYFDRARSVLKHWKGIPIQAVADTKVDGVTGATYSSNSLNENVRAALLGFQQLQNTSTFAPTQGWGKTIVVIFVLCFGAFVAFRRKGKKNFRRLVMVLNVLVLGFWTGEFLSVTLLHGWALHGCSWLGELPLVVMLLFTLIIPFFTRNNYYCHWVCPYGSLQELSRLLPVKPIKVSQKFYRFIRYLRIVLLMLLLTLLWLGSGAQWLEYEPFAAFMVESAPWVVIVIAVTFLLAGLFVPRVWCQGFCPMGMLLDLMEDKQPRQHHSKSK